MSLKAIFFDVGGTLVFPDEQRTLEPLAAKGLKPTSAQLFAAERDAKAALDRTLLRHAGNGVDKSYWDNYYSALLAQFDLCDDELKQALIRRAQTSSNWTRLAADTRAVLQDLAREYRLGIISNSDGGIAQLLTQLRIRDLFHSVVDSGVVGHQKPDPRIFEAALNALGVEPAEALHLGDIYAVDYAGATSVGMKAILMDTAGVYRHTGLARVESLGELASRLAAEL